MAKKTLTRKTLTTRTKNIEGRIGKLSRQVRSQLKDQAKKRRNLRNLLSQSRKLKRRTSRLNQRVLGLEKSDKQLKQRTAKQVKYTKALKKADERLDRRTSKLGRNLKRLDKVNSKLKKRTFGLRKKIGGLEKRDKRLEQRTDWLRNNASDLKRAYKKLKRRTSQLKKGIKGLEQNDKRIIRRTNRLKKSVEGLEQTDNKVLRRTKRLKESVKGLEKNDGKFKQQLLRLEKTTSGLTKSNEKFRGRWKDLQVKIDDLNKQFGDQTDIEESPGVREMKALHDRVASIDQKTGKSVEGLEQTDKKVLRRTKRLKESVKGLEKNGGKFKQQLSRLEETTSGLTKSNEKLRGRWKDLQVKIDDLNKQFGDQTDIEESPGGREMKALHDRVASIDQKTGEFLGQIRELKSGIEVPEFKEQLLKLEGDTLDLACRLDSFEAKNDVLSQLTEELEENSDGLLERTVRLENLISTAPVEEGQPLRTTQPVAGLEDHTPTVEITPSEFPEKIEAISLVLQGLEERTTDHEGQVSALTDDQAIQKEKLDTAESEVVKLGDQTERLSSAVQDISDKLDSFSTHVDAVHAADSVHAEEVNDAVSARVKEAFDAVAVLNEEAGSERQRIDELASVVVELRSTEQRLTTQASELDRKIQGLDLGIGSQGEKLEDLGLAVKGYDEHNIALAQQNKDLSESLGKLSSETQDHEGQVSILTADQAMQKDNLDTAKSEVVKLGDQTERLSSAVQDISDKLDSFSTHVDAVHAADSLHAEEVNDAVSARVQEAFDAVALLNEEAGSESERIDELTNVVVELRATEQRLTTQASELDRKIQDLDHKIGSQGEKLEGLGLAVKGYDEHNIVLLQQNKDLSESLGILSSETQDHEGQVSILTADQAMQKEKLDTAQSEVVKLGDQTERLSSAVQDISDKLDSFSTRVDAVHDADSAHAEEVNNAVAALNEEAGNERQRIDELASVVVELRATEQRLTTQAGELDKKIQDLDLEIVSQGGKLEDLGLSVKGYDEHNIVLVQQNKDLSESLGKLSSETHSLTTDNLHQKKRIQELSSSSLRTKVIGSVAIAGLLLSFSLAHILNSRKLDAEQKITSEKIESMEQRLSDSLGQGIHVMASLTEFRGSLEQIGGRVDRQKEDVGSELNMISGKIDSMEQRLSDSPDQGKHEQMMASLTEFRSSLDQIGGRVDRQKEDMGSELNTMSGKIDSMEQRLSDLPDQGRHELVKVSLTELRDSPDQKGGRVDPQKEDMGSELNTMSRKKDSVEQRLSDSPDQGRHEQMMASLTEFRGSLDQIGGRVDRQKDEIGSELKMISGKILRLRENTEHNDALFQETSYRMTAQITGLDERMNELQHQTAELKERIIPIGDAAANWDKARQQNHYSIQLVSVLNKHSMLSFIDKNDLYENTAYLQSVVQGKQWFVLLYGMYATVKEAKTALEGLPPELSKYEPWIRPLGEQGKAYPLP